MTSPLYEKSGVDIAAGEALVERIKQSNPHIGGFAGLYPLDEHRSLVACTDGVGTKLEIGIAMEAYESLGQDLVAMSVNDLIVCGGKPLFFLDYFATGKLDVNVAHRVIQGIQQACKQSGCLLLGGETAEMPGFYEAKKFDLAGFAVGEVENQNIINGHHIQKGDRIVGLKSSGFHANGYSLIRKILKDNLLSLHDQFENKSWGEILTTPTKLYVREILQIQKQVTVRGMTHITGGGLTNLSRVIPKHLHYKIHDDTIPTPSYMHYLKKIGSLSKEEAYTVWNMGMGFALIVPPTEASVILERIPDSFIAGEIIENIQ
jgi:phosphoribosylformylglycinamidine cyclo-ligase